MTPILGFFTPWIIYAMITLLHMLIPARQVVGYVNKTGTNTKLKYRLNGLPVLFCSLGIWIALGHLDIVPYDWLYTVRWYSLLGAFVLGVLYTFWIVLPHRSTGKSFLADLYLGRLENPQYKDGFIDAKMWLYLIGAVMLALNTLSFVAYHYLTFGSESSPGIFLSAGLLMYFILDYLTFEKVHLYTYDIFAERVGFKLGWGCLTFYPYFYSIPIWATAHMPSAGNSTWQLILFALIFFIGWSLARGANMQKFYFKTQQEKTFLGIRPETISDGKRTLLVNGFWGMSRHINYLGEILMATGIVLSIGHFSCVWPWLYPLYYIALLFPRQIDDDKRCQLKYGQLWDKYSSRVKYKIIPYVY